MLIKSTVASVVATTQSYEYHFCQKLKKLFPVFNRFDQRESKILQKNNNKISLATPSTF